jgi:hypothetical protein
MVCKNGLASAELHNVVAIFLQMVTDPHYFGRKSVSSWVCWHFGGKLKILV